MASAFIQMTPKPSMMASNKALMTLNNGGICRVKNGSGSVTMFVVIG